MWKAISLGAAISALALAAVASSASAAIVVKAFDGGMGAGNFPAITAPTGFNVIDTFDAPIQFGFKIAGALGIEQGKTQYTAEPAFESTGYYASDMYGKPAWLVAPKGTELKSFAMYVGSLDPTNELKFYNSNGVVIYDLTGAQLQGMASVLADGNQKLGTSNFELEITGLADVTKVGFYTHSASFEFDNLAGQFSGTPEPMTWALMIVGMFGVGAALRRNRVALA